MSLLERVVAGHLSDRQLARIWTDGASHPHLQGCAACRERYGEWQAWLARLDADLRAEADEAFPAERLAAQQSQIARRLEALEHPARVIRFPRAARAVMSNQSHAGRWVAAAAAAGLIAGIGLGQVVDIGRTFATQAPTRTSSRAEAAGTSAAGQGVRPISAVSFSDEAFLMGTDALAQPRVSELRAIDDLTPQARDLIRPR